MIVDPSALIAVITGGPDAEIYAAALLSGAPALGAPTLLEASIVARPERREALDTLVRRTLTEVVPFTEEHARVALEAYVRYGRGPGSPARLNLGDCMSYAVAKLRGEPPALHGRRLLPHRRHARPSHLSRAAPGRHDPGQRDPGQRDPAGRAPDGRGLG